MDTLGIIPQFRRPDLSALLEIYWTWMDTLGIIPQLRRPDYIECTLRNLLDMDGQCGHSWDYTSI